MWRISASTGLDGAVSGSRLFLLCFSLYIILFSSSLLLECYGAGLQDVTRRICLHGADEVFFYLFM